MINRVVGSWGKFPSPLEDEGGDYNCEELHNGCKLHKRIWLWDYCKPDS